ncbi:MAG: diacylglycerol/polyprenol kinase family protein [Bacteroidota bacterium]
MHGLPNVEQSYGVEFVRKGIHLCSLSIPIIYYFIPKATALAILIPLTLLFAVTDFARHRVPAISSLYLQNFGWLLRSHERDDTRRSFTGATYVLLSAVIGILVFPKVVFISAFAILIVSDTLAALVGRKYGTKPFLKKSRAGALAFLVSALAVIAVAPKIHYLPTEYFIGAIGAVIGTVAESLSISVDDNLSIPISIGVAMWVLYALLLPSVNVFSLDALR